MELASLRKVTGSKSCCQSSVVTRVGAPQALQPFIDPRTARKVVFVTRGAGDRELAGVLAPGALAVCGVGTPGWKFDAVAYQATCRVLEQRAHVPVSALDSKP